MHIPKRQLGYFSKLQVKKKLASTRFLRKNLKVKIKMVYNST